MSYIFVMLNNYGGIVALSLKKSIKLGGGILIGILFLFLLVHHENWQKVLDAFKNISFFWVLVAFLLFVISFFLRAERWYLILKTYSEKERLNRHLGYEIFFLGMGTNALLPFRLGDVLRGTLFSSCLGLPRMCTLTAVCLEKLFDLVVICSIGFTMFAFFPIEHNEILKIGTKGLGYIVILLFAILLGAHYLRGPIAYILEKIKKNFVILKRIITFIEHQMHHVCDALALINTKRIFSLLLFCSVTTWLAEICGCYCVALAFPSIIHPAASWAAMPIAVLSTALPGAPGAIGTFDFFAERVMRLWDNPKSASTAYAFMVHIIVLMVPVFLALGAWFLNPRIFSYLLKKGCNRSDIS